MMQILNPRKNETYGNTVMRHTVLRYLKYFLYFLSTFLTGKEKIFFIIFTEKIILFLIKSNRIFLRSLCGRTNIWCALLSVRFFPVQMPSTSSTATSKRIRECFRIRNLADRIVFDFVNAFWIWEYFSHQKTSLPR